MNIFPFNKVNSKNAHTAVIPQQGGLAIAISDRSSAGDTVLSKCEFVECGPAQNEQRVLREKVREYGLRKQSFATSLALGEYTILSVEAPEVPAAELKAAIRWQVKDMIDFHIDDAVLDVFDAPAAGVNGQQHSLYVVVTRKSTIAEHIKPFHDMDANLTTIDIPELVLRNIAVRLPQDENGVVMVYMTADKGLIIITRRHTLYLARSLDFGYAGMREEGARGSALVASEVDRLGLEIQRSMDYYDRYFMQSPVSELLIAPMPVDIPGLVARLTGNLGISADILDLNSVIGGDLQVTPALQSHCLLAIGAALRQERQVL